MKSPRFATAAHAAFVSSAPALAGTAVVLALSLVFAAAARAQVEPPARPVTPPAVVDVPALRAGGAAAVRLWVENRVNEVPGTRAAARKRFDASQELAAYLFNAAAGEVVEVALKEIETRLAPAKAGARNEKVSAQMTASLGVAYERMMGDRAKAREWYEQALQLDAEDRAALAGLARLERAEAIDEQKEIEVARLKELEAFWEKQPRSRPPERTPFDEVVPPAQKP